MTLSARVKLPFERAGHWLLVPLSFRRETSVIGSMLKSALDAT